MNIDEHTQNAIEIVSEGTKLTSQLILFVLKSAVDMLEKEEDRNKIIINNSDKDGKQKIKDLLSKHKDNVETLDGNLTKEQLKDYQKELKKLGVDFSVVKNGKDNYSFFFAAEQANIIEKALKNVLEQKSIVKNNEKVKEAELDLNAEKNNFTEKEIEKVKNIYDKVTEKIELTDESKKEILNEIEKIGFKNKFDTVGASDKEEKFEIVIRNTKDNTWGDGDLKIEINKETGKANIFENNIDSENWSKSEFKLIKNNLDLNIDLNKFKLAKDNIEKQPEVQDLSDKEKILISKIKNLDQIEKEIQSKIKDIFKEYKQEISSEKINKEITTEESKEKIIKPTTKEESKLILKEKLSQLTDKELNLFEQRIKFENLATAPKFDSQATYTEADKLKKMQKDYSKETIKKINNLDNEIRSLNNFDKNLNTPKLSANEILKETKEFKKERESERSNVKNEKKYSIENIKKINKEIKTEEKDKPVIKNKEYSL